MRPASGRRNPVSWLKSVLLPAPFGPMMARNSARPTSNDTSLVATRPPKRLCSPTARKIGSGTASPVEETDDAFGHQHDDGDHQHAEDQRPVFGVAGEHGLQHHIDRGADHRAD